MNEPKAWECSRCHRMNAPHVDHCDCEPEHETTAAPPEIVRIYIFEGTHARVIWPTPLPDTNKWPPPLTAPYIVTCGTTVVDARSPAYTVQFPNVRQ